MNKVKKFQYNGTVINFHPTKGEGMVNATQMAKVFCKKVFNFKRNKEIKDFIKILETQFETRLKSRSANSRFYGKDKPNIIGLKKEDISNMVIFTNKGRNSTTWMCYPLAIRFAMWLNPEFSVWVCEKIFELLKTGQVSINEDAPNHRTDTQAPPPTSTQRINELHQLLNDKIDEWDNKDQQPKVTYKVFRQHVAVHEAMEAFFSKNKSYTRYVDAVNGYQVVQSKLEDFGLMVKPLVGLDNDGMSEEEVLDFIAFMKSMSMAYAKMASSDKYQRIMKGLK